jgi:predicted phosphohydrolase
VKLVLLSDTHDQRPVVPDGDVLVVAGDVFCGDDLVSFRRDISWFNSLGFPHIVMTLGNHDLIARHNPRVLESAKGIHLLADSGTEIDGIRFYGIDSDSNVSVPPGTDVVVSHFPPAGILDGGFGSIAVKKAVLSAKPRLHVFGHAHGARGHVVSGGTHFYNATLDVTTDVIGAMSHTAKQSPTEQPWVHDLEVTR